MAYIDGFIAAVPTANKHAYLEHVRKSAPLFKEYGATGLTEAWGDDVPEGKVTSFPMAVKAQPDETVVFAYVTWPSKQARDEAWEKMKTDTRFHPENNPMPFDGMRLIYGGFQTIFDETL